MTTSRKVVLFYPAYDRPPLGASLGFVTLASPLLRSGFDIALVSVTASDFESVLLRETERAFCLAISLPTGSAIRVAQASRKLRPHLSIIFGGWHPTLIPDESLAEPYVDMVVGASGEWTFCELAEPIAGGHSGDGIRRISFKHGADVHHEMGRPVANLSDLPAPDFHVAQFDRYELSGLRPLAYANSMRCPYASN